MAIIDNYTPYTWTDKELITATKLNRIENTIAAINDGAINTIGDSTMNGSIYFINQNEWNETPVIYALGQNGNLGLGGTILYKHSDNSGNPRYQWYFRQQIPRGSDTSVYEQYCFPTVDTTRTESATYTILTTKYSGALSTNVSFSAVEVPANTPTEIGTITVPSSNKTQTYILVVSCWWGSVSDGNNDNGSGMRRLGISVGTNFNNDRTCTVSQPACSGIATDQQLTTIFQVTGNSSDIIWHINAKHSSTGNTLYARAGYRLISIT